MLSQALQAAVVRLEEYVLLRGLTVGDRLGWGQDGVVYRTADSSSAIKAFGFQPQYERERDAYLRLQSKGVRTIGVFSIPRLRFYDDRLWIVEMDIVSPPFIVDFASARLDRRHHFTEEDYENWEDLFGRYWEEVDTALSKLRGIGIHLSDISLSNVNCGSTE